MAPSTELPPEIMHEGSLESLHAFDHYNSSASKEVSIVQATRKWFRRQYSDVRNKARTYGPCQWLGVFFPCFAWLNGYSVRQNLLIDLTAGVSIGFMVVPQGMSYALLAGLPAVYGLYASLMPVFAYAVFGSSRHLAVGPVAVTSLLLGHALRTIYPEAEQIVDPNSPVGALAFTQAQYNQAAVQVTFLVGLLYLAVGALQLGFLANFLSHSVISGFTTGAACIIGLSQFKYLLGISIKSTHTAFQTAVEIAKHLPETQWREVLMCSFWLAMLLGIKAASKRVPKLSWLRPLGPLSVCVIAILAVVIGKLDERGLIRTVKHVPSGLPDITINQWFPMTHVGKQVSTAFLLFLVGFMESISISKALARKHKYTINITQEIIAMGVANLFGSMLSAYPATGSFSRSAVSGDIGAKTALQGAITGGVVTLVLLFITPIFERVPYNAMGAIVLSSVLGLLEWPEAVFLYKANILDFLVWMAAFLGTIFLGVEAGLGIAIGLAIVLVIYQSAFPHTAVLGRLPDTDIYRSKKQYPVAEELLHVLVVRVDAPIYFANVEWIQGRIDKYLAKGAKSIGPIKFLVLDLSPVPFIDSAGMHALTQRIDSLKADGMQLVLANPSAKVQGQLLRVGLVESIGQEWIFVHTADAVKVCRAAVAERLRHSERPSDETDAQRPLVVDSAQPDLDDPIAEIK